MEEHFIRTYIEKILEEIEGAEKAYNKILEPIQDIQDIDDTFRNIHYFVLHVSNIFKFIQPNSKELEFSKFRMKSLRIKYPHLPKIDHKSILIRNDFEHYDERIDSWIINSEAHNLADKNIGNVKSIDGLSSTDYFRTYDPDTKILTFNHTEYSLKKLHLYTQQTKKAIITK